MKQTCGNYFVIHFCLPLILRIVCRIFQLLTNQIALNHREELTNELRTILVQNVTRNPRMIYPIVRTYRRNMRRCFIECGHGPFYFWIIIRLDDYELILPTVRLAKCPEDVLGETLWRSTSNKQLKVFLGAQTSPSGLRKWAIIFHSRVKVVFTLIQYICAFIVSCIRLAPGFSAITGDKYKIVIRSVFGATFWGAPSMGVSWTRKQFCRINTPIKGFPLPLSPLDRKYQSSERNLTLPW